VTHPGIPLQGLMNCGFDLPWAHCRKHSRRRGLDAFAMQSSICPEVGGCSISQIECRCRLEQSKRGALFGSWCTAFSAVLPDPPYAQGNPRACEVRDAESTQVPWPANHAPSDLAAPSRHRLAPRPDEGPSKLVNRCHCPRREAQGDGSVNGDCGQGRFDQRCPSGCIDHCKLLSNYKLTKLKNFVSQIINKFCN
jgi:hypothetical protein